MKVIVDRVGFGRSGDLVTCLPAGRSGTGHEPIWFMARYREIGESGLRTTT